MNEMQKSFVSQLLDCRLSQFLASGDYSSALMLVMDAYSVGCLDKREYLFLLSAVRSVRDVEQSALDVETDSFIARLLSSGKGGALL